MMIRLIIRYIILRWLMMVAFKAQTDPVETVFVKVEGDFSNLLAGADEQLSRASAEAQKIGKATGEAADSVEMLGDEMAKTSEVTEGWIHDAVRMADAIEELGELSSR